MCIANVSFLAFVDYSRVESVSFYHELSSLGSPRVLCFPRVLSNKKIFLQIILENRNFTGDKKSISWSILT